MAKRRIILPPRANVGAWGRVGTAEDNGSPPLIHVHCEQQDIQRELAVWVPNKALKNLVPEGAVVILRCETAGDGERRFSPIGTGNRSFGPFLPFHVYAFVCGMAIRCKTEKRMTKNTRQSYREMSFLFQRALKMRQHIRRSFNTTKDLVIAKQSRNADPNETHVLPWSFGKTTKKLGYPQSVVELIERGTEAARRAGVRRPSASQKTHFGLVEVARLEPKPLERHEALCILKSVLFNIDPTWGPVPQSIRAHVEERVLTAIDRHLDDTEAAFDDWLWGRHNSFIKQIAKQERSPGGRLDPDVVEQVLLERGWEAYEYMGQCLHAWARDMEKAMPKPLTEGEKRAFEWLYFPQPQFGGIPLIFLAEKLQFIDTVVEDIVNHPGDDRPVQVLYRLLQFYSMMVSSRREADVRIKEAAKATRKRLNKESGQILRGDAVLEAPDSSDAESRLERRSLAAALYNRVAYAKGFTCNCSSPDWKVKTKEEETDDSLQFRLTFSCKKCKTRRSVTMSAEELRQLGSRLK